jgi:GNAT superfamily N-acetyltransferase
MPVNLDDPPNSGLYVSSDQALLDFPWVIRTIRETYWGGHRTERTIRLSILNSLCFGLYEHTPRDGGSNARDPQIGFARVITDYATFAELVDVVIDPSRRKCGLGKFLVSTILRDPRISGTVINLGTRDAHAFYEQMGFKRVEKMKRIPGQTGA